MNPQSANVCPQLHTGVLARVVREYKAALRELVWADAPHDAPAPPPASPRPPADEVSGVAFCFRD